MDKVADLRRLELGRLDLLLAAHWDAATAGDVRATDRVLRIIDTRVRLLGLDRDAWSPAERDVVVLSSDNLAGDLQALVEGRDGAR